MTIVTIDKLLGSGAHKAAYTVKEHPDLVIVQAKPGFFHRLSVTQEMSKVSQLPKSEHLTLPYIDPTLRLQPGQFLLRRAEGTLQARMKKQTITATECHTIALHIFKGLIVLHQKNIIHGDIKPENILVFKEESSTPSFQINDFGQTRFCSVSEEFSLCFGDREFQPPEYVSSKKSDLYGTGMVFADLLRNALHPKGSALLPLSDFLAKANVHPGSSFSKVLNSLLYFILKTCFNFTPKDTSRRQAAINIYLEDIHNQIKLMKDSDDKIKLQKLLAVTKKMLDPNPEERASAEDLLKDIILADAHFKPSTPPRETVDATS